MSKLWQSLVERRRMTLILTALIIVSMFVFWIFDRTAPVVMHMDGYTVPQGTPGQEIAFRVPVTRNLHKWCSLKLSRSIVDSSRAIRAYGSEQNISPQGIRIRDELSRSEIFVKITIPESMPSGDSHLLTETTYTCLSNPTTYFFPVQVSMDWPFTVTPPKIIVPTKELP